MAVTIIDPYDAQMPFPIDLRFRRNSIEDRDAMPSNIRWEGMPVYVVNEEAWFYLKGGVLNENWEPLSGDGAGGALQNVYFNSTQPTTQGNDGDIWFRPNDDTTELWFKVTGIWTMLGDWGSGGGGAKKYVVELTADIVIDWDTDILDDGKTFAELLGNSFLWSAYYTVGGREVSYTPPIAITRSGGDIVEVEIMDVNVGYIVLI